MLKRLILLALVPAALVTAAASAHEQATTAASSEQIPLGDGKFQTSGPKKGYVYSCYQVGGGGGAFKDGPWIKANGTWVPSEKISVQGSVSWPQATFTSKLSGSKLLLSGNGLPTNHATGTFPIAASDPAYSYDRNPNRITAQDLSLSLASSPKKASKPSCLPLGTIGVMLNGVQLFNGLDLQGKDAAAHEIQDTCQGHPEMTGDYHYHSLSSCISDSGKGHSRLLGYALDGFGIYGKRGTDGKAMTNSQLDTCHGHSHKLTVGGKRKTRYHYHTTSQYPYTLGCFTGKPITVQASAPQATLPPRPPIG